MEKTLVNMFGNQDYNTVTVMGLKGSGKTFGLSIIAKSIPNKQVWIFDTLGAMSINSLLPNAYYVKMGPASQRKVLKLFESLYTSKLRFIVFDLSIFNLKELVEFADLFSEWALKRGNIAVIVDEIVDYCPQAGTPYSTGLQRLWRAGRNFGIYPVVMATQRPQEADKKILAHAQLYFIMKLLHPLDLKKVEEILPVEPEDWMKLKNQIKELEKRNAVVYDGVHNKVYGYTFPLVKDDEVDENGKG